MKRKMKEHGARLIANEGKGQTQDENKRHVRSFVRCPQELKTGKKESICSPPDKRRAEMKVDEGGC